MREVSRGIELEENDPCFDFECEGHLHRILEANGKEFMRCDSCKGSLPVLLVKSVNAGAVMDPEGNVTTGGTPVSIPPPILMHMAKVMFEAQGGKGWAALKQEDRGNWINSARRLLTPVWTSVADYFGFKEDDQETTNNAKNALEEIALPFMKMVEEEHGVSPKARWALEAAVNLKSNEG